MTDDDYSDHPVSITEARSERGGPLTAHLWTPRDCLIEALRAIDRGEWAPDALAIIGITDLSTERMQMTYRQAVPTRMTLLAMYTRAILEIDQ